MGYQAGLYEKRRLLLRSQIRACGDFSRGRVRTFVEPVHVQLPYEGGNVGMLEIRSIRRLVQAINMVINRTYDKTFENSVDGDITKLSLVFDHDIKC